MQIINSYIKPQSVRETKFHLIFYSYFQIALYIYVGCHVILNIKPLLQNSRTEFLSLSRTRNLLKSADVTAQLVFLLVIGNKGFYNKTFI